MGPPHFSLAARAEAIARSSFFRGLDAEWVRALAEAAEPRVRGSGEVLVEAGRLSDSLQLLLSGRVSVLAESVDGGRPEVLHQLRAGAVLGRGPVTGEPEVCSFVAEAPVELLGWSAASVAALVKKVPFLHQRLKTGLSVTRRRRELVRFLRDLPAFRDVSASLLLTLLSEATLAFFPGGTTVCRQGEEGDSLFVVVQGELVVSRAVGPEGEPAPSLPVGVLRVGDCLGETALLERTARNATVRTLRDAELLVIGREAFDGLCRASHSFRRTLTALSQERSVAIVHPGWSGQMTLLVNHTALPSGLLWAQLGRVLESSGHGRVLLVEIGPAGSESGRRPLAPGVELCSLSAEHPQTLGRRIEAEAQAGGFSQVLVFPHPQDKALTQSLLSLEASVFFLASDEDDTFPYEAGALRSIRYGVVNGPGRRAERAIFRGAVRLLLPQTLPSLESRPSPKMVCSLERLARALTHRSVGVALGGGGAWGFAHHALLRGLARRQIPVDLLTGVSFGSLVGAFYSGLGEGGLSVLEERRMTLEVLLPLCAVSAWPISRFISSYLPHRRLEDLELPFYPVAVDIRSGEETVFRRGTIVEAVHASGAFPGLFAPAMVNGRCYVDGGVLNNVPAGVLAQEGADFVIASNVIPNPKALKHRQGGSRLGNWRRQWSLADRIEDGVRSIYLLLHSTGEHQAQGADVTFSPALDEFLPHDFPRGPDIIRRAEEQLEPVLDEIAARYRAFC